MKTCIFTVCAFLISVTGIAQNQSGYMKYSLSIEGENAEMMAPLMPNTMELFYGHNKSLLRISGGMASGMFGDVLTDNSRPDTAYMIMHARQTIYLMASGSEGQNSDTAPAELKVQTEKTGKTEKISGYNAEEYKITSTGSDNKSVVSYLWTTKDINIPKPEAAAKGSQFGAMFQHKVEGFPVRYQMPLNQAGMNMTSTVTLLEYNQKEQPKSTFELPAKYKRETFSAEKLMQR